MVLPVSTNGESAEKYEIAKKKIQKKVNENIYILITHLDGFVNTKMVLFLARKINLSFSLKINRN